MEIESPKYLKQRFLPFRPITVESEDTPCLNSTEKSIEKFKPKMLILSSSPQNSRSEDELKASSFHKASSGSPLEGKPIPNEKKVPHAPRNLTKINFNFDKGFLADRCEKKVPAVAVPSSNFSLSDEYLGKKISSLRSKNKNLKINDIELSMITPGEQPVTSPLGLGYSLIAAKQEPPLEEKLRAKDVLIAELRAEVDALNSKNRSLISEVTELRDTIVKLESQLELAYRSSLESRLSNNKFLRNQKVDYSLRQERTMDARINFTKEAILSSSDLQIMKTISMKDKSKDFGTLVNKFSGSKKHAATPISAVSGIILQSNTMLTPKSITKVTFHSKSSRALTPVKSMTTSDFIKERVKATHEDLGEVKTSSRKTPMEKTSKLSINFEGFIKRPNGIGFNSSKKMQPPLPQTPAKVSKANLSNMLEPAKPKTVGRSHHLNSVSARVMEMRSSLGLKGFETRMIKKRST